MKDPGEPLIVSAFALGILGIALRYLFLRKRVWVLAESSAQGTFLGLKAHARPCDALYAREVGQIVEELEQGT